MEHFSAVLPQLDNDFLKQDKIDKFFLSVNESLNSLFDMLFAPLILLHHKVGVLHANRDQKSLSKDSFYRDSEQEIPVESLFWAFLEGISNKILLKNWPFYAGGLDTEGGIFSNTKI